MKKIVLSYITMFVLLCGCTSYNRIYDTLLDVESYIQERPDSALVVLDSMDRSLLATNKLKAHHALLHAMALDKNYIDVSDDSLARVAVEYFSKHGPDKYETRSLYYLALAYYYQGEYTKSIIELTKAESIAELSDAPYLGFIKVLQADVYDKTHNAIEQLNCLKQAYSVALEVGNEYYIHVSKFRLAQALYDISNVDTSLSLLSELLNDEVDSNIRSAATSTYAFIKTLDKDSDLSEVIRLYRTVLDGSEEVYMSYKDYWALAYALYKTGDKESAEYIIDELDDTVSGTTSYWKYLIYKDEDSRTALSYLEDYIKYNDIEVSDALKQSLALAQRDYYASQAELSEYKTHNARLTLFIVLLATFFIFILAFVSIKMYVRRQEAAKDRYLASIDEIRRQLEEAKKDDYPALKKKYISLYKSKFETIGALCEQYSNSQGLVNAEVAVYKKVVTLVDEFRNDYQNREKFESMLDSDLDNIMTNLRTEVPKLKEIDYMIFSLIVIGFDVTTISHILEVSMNTIYIRKSRLKQRIEDLNPPHKDQFLSILG